MGHFLITIKNIMRDFLLEWKCSGRLGDFAVMKSGHHRCHPLIFVSGGGKESSKRLGLSEAVHCFRIVRFEDRAPNVTSRVRITPNLCSVSLLALSIRLHDLHKVGVTWFEEGDSISDVKGLAENQCTWSCA